MAWLLGLLLGGHELSLGLGKAVWLPSKVWQPEDN